MYLTRHARRRKDGVHEMQGHARLHGTIKGGDNDSDVLPAPDEVYLTVED